MLSKRVRKFPKDKEKLIGIRGKANSEIEVLKNEVVTRNRIFPSKKELLVLNNG